MRFLVLGTPEMDCRMILGKTGLLESEEMKSSFPVCGEKTETNCLLKCSALMTAANEKVCKERECV